MVKSPNRGTPSVDYDTIRKLTKYALACGIVAAFITTIIFVAMSSDAMSDVFNEGSNPRNASDTNLSTPEKDLQSYSSAAVAAFGFTALLTLMYIAVKL